MSKESARERMKQNIRNILAIKEWMTQKDIEKHLGASMNSTRNYLAALVEIGVVETHVPDPTKKAWKLNRRTYRAKGLAMPENEIFEKAFAVIARINHSKYNERWGVDREKEKERWEPSPYGRVCLADARGDKLMQTERKAREERKKNGKSIARTYGVTDYSNMFMGA